MKIDALIAESIYDLIAQLNYIKVQGNNIVSVFQDTSGKYIAVYQTK